MQTNQSRLVYAIKRLMPKTPQGRRHFLFAVSVLGWAIGMFQPYREFFAFNMTIIFVSALVAITTLRAERVHQCSAPLKALNAGD